MPEKGEGNGRGKWERFMNLRQSGKNSDHLFPFAASLLRLALILSFDIYNSITTKFALCITQDRAARALTGKDSLKDQPKKGDGFIKIRTPT